MNTLGQSGHVQLFSNPKVLTNIHCTDNTMYIRFNPRLSSATMQGTLPGYKHVWCHPYGIANIQSLAHVKEKYPSAITALICSSQTQQVITWGLFLFGHQCDE